MTALTKQQYHETIRTLSEASTHVHFQAFKDIDWDHPDNAIDPADPRWVLAEADALGRHPWYKAQPVELQARIGLMRYANIAKVGMQFENVLIRGVADYVYHLRNGNPEFRYLTHENTEECHHTQMFQEFVNRSGMDVGGAPGWFNKVARLLPLAGSLWPEVFFTGILAGEEPIDHAQKAVLRSGDVVHPLFRRIMQIHVAEEARHISFAHMFLTQRIPKLGRRRRAVLSVAFPIVMRTLADVIMIPDRKASEAMGIPRWVIKEVFWDSADGEQMLRELFADVRLLAEETGLMNKTSRRVWKRLRIDGRPSRFRGEPAPLASRAAA
ncbi:diiron oxygenase [Streptomyces polyrhachis]|uniref:Diiron oxygenase n=1 Tax=Streptomyces polyrhachis TaxID=1282885 RepID=A0ABW2GGS7_9ACTN